MKLVNKIVFLIVIVFFVFTIFSVNRSYALSNSYNIEFDLKKENYKGNFSSQYREVKINNIAPGTEGNINIKINNSNRNVKYILNFKEEKDKPQNMKFYYNGKEYTSLLKLNNYLNGKVKKEEKIEIQIKYKWNYETGNNNYEIEKNDEIDKSDNNKLFKFKIVLEAEEDDDSVEKNTMEAKDDKNIEEDDIGPKQAKNKIYDITNNITSPKTGDNIYIFVFILIISIIGIYIIVVKLKNNK